MKPIKHQLFLSWLILTGIIAFSLFVAWEEEILVLLYRGDKSYISMAITLLYSLVTLHCLIRVWHISTEMNATASIDELIKSSGKLSLAVKQEQVVLNNQATLPESVTSSFFKDLIIRSENYDNKSPEQGEDNSSLISIYESKLKGPHELGWFVTEVMVKLGLLGTVIGFILMLGSVVNVTEFDVTTMQKILANMSSGMGTALYTTMAGLVCSILGAAQYLMMEREIDKLLETSTHLAEVYVQPRLNTQ